VLLRRHQLRWRIRENVYRRWRICAAGAEEPFVLGFAGSLATPIVNRRHSELLTAVKFGIQQRPIGHKLIYGLR